MNDAELRRRAHVRAIAFVETGPLNRDEAIRALTRVLVEFVHEALVGDISDGPFIHWLREQPPVGRRRFASVACGRTFNLHSRAGRFQAITNLQFVTCPTCRAIATLEVHSS